MLNQDCGISLTKLAFILSFIHAHPAVLYYLSEFLVSFKYYLMKCTGEYYCGGSSFYSLHYVLVALFELVSPRVMI